MNDISTQIGRNAKGLRKAYKLTLQEVADRADLAKSYVWEIESGKNTNPSIASLAKLCTALGCSLDQIVGRETYMKPSIRPDCLKEPPFSKRIGNIPSPCLSNRS